MWSSPFMVVEYSAPRNDMKDCIAPIRIVSPRSASLDCSPEKYEFPVFSFDEFHRGIADLPRRYAVIMDLNTARGSHSGYTDFDLLREDPVLIVRSGGAEAARAYLDKARSRHNTSKMGSWHPFKVVKDVDQPQATVPALSGNLGGTGSEDDDFHVYGRHSDYGIV